MNNAAALWSGTADQALATLRAEWLHISATMAARLGGERPVRDAALKAALSSITGGYAVRLGVLLAAAPAAKRAAIAEAFAQVLDVATAAKMRGVAAGTVYRFECWIDDVKQQPRQMYADERGARQLAKKAEQDALAAGAQNVRITWKLMNEWQRRAA